jgi:hypothetical protein
MELNGSQTYPASIDAVIALLRDASATVDKYESMGSRDVKIIDVSSDDTHLRVASSRVVDVDLPSFAKKALKPTNTMTQTDDWHRDADGVWRGTFDVDVKGAPVHIKGTMTLTPNGPATRHDVTVDVQVKIPLIGGKIADWAAKNDVRRTLDAEFAYNDKRLSS